MDLLDWKMVDLMVDLKETMTATYLVDLMAKKKVEKMVVL